MSSSNSFVFCLFLLKLVINPGVTAAVRFTTDGQPSNVTVLQGDSVHVHCRVTGLLRENKYFIIWLFNNGYIRTDKVRRNIVSRFTSESRDRSELTAVSSFNITHTETADQGFYRCTLYENNNPVLTSKQGFVRVISRPKFRRQPSNQTVVEGQNVTLSCTVENYDVAHYVKWFRRGKIIADYSIHETNKSHPGDLSSQEVSGSGTFDLHINNISREISGKFQCKVFARGYGKSILQSNTARITVRYPPQMLYPQCNSSNINNVYMQGDVIEATCWAKGGNAPVYFEWMKGGTINNGTLEEFGNLYVGKMRWNLTVHDDGEYISCNMKGFAILNDRQCIIGPLKVQSSRVSTFVSTDGYLYTNSRIFCTVFCCQRKPNVVTTS
ncbi:limbic system-associated membrane protein-like [Ptychodera flava]|uniref:limbic system-associated membrane protein-like n=1 Tax=Ptychodera flava TaxID=63121 RepID=UPI003969FE0D